MSNLTENHAQNAFHMIIEQNKEQVNEKQANLNEQAQNEQI